MHFTVEKTKVLPELPSGSPDEILDAIAYIYVKKHLYAFEVKVRQRVIQVYDPRTSYSGFVDPNIMTPIATLHVGDILLYDGEPVFKVMRFMLTASPKYVSVLNFS